MINRRGAVGTIGLSIITSVLLASAASGQQASGIAGAVRDGSGGVMPGVTVEASSPALIEKVRAVVTDGQGRYSIDDLRPGTYVVTFSLVGFNTTKREGIVLTAGFTATVNADLQVGALEETITVTGAAPLVDAQNVRVQTVVSSRLLAALPSSTASIANLITLTVGMTGTIDVGGSSGLYKSNTPSANRFHGKTGAKNMVDGMNTMAIGVGMTYVVNMAAAEETTVDAGGASAESSLNAIQLNLVPKEGGNAFTFRTAGTYGGEHLQNDNLTDALRALGVTETSKVYYIYDFNTTAGGPVKQDRLWFFIMNREAGNKNLVPALYFNKTQGTPFYTPDLERPAYRKEGLETIGGRLTWQASPRNKVSGFVDVQHFPVRGRAEFASPEAYLYLHNIEPRLYQGNWSSPMTSKLLLEAGASYMTGGWPYAFPGDGDFRVGPNDISIREASTGLQYNSKAAYNAITEQNRFAQRFSVSYVTGSHSYKAGVQTEVGISNSSSEVIGDVNYTFLRGVPNSITMFATPYLQKTREREVALFAQDRWTIKRLTVNYGVRFDSVDGWVPAQQVPDRRFVPIAINYAPVYGVPAWRDLNPRLGASYDLFGDGRTAVKVSVGRYVETGGGGLAGQSNPITTSVTSTTRTWNDTNGNYVPDCNLSTFAANGECGAIDNLNFGQNNPLATRFSDAVLRSSRKYTWDVTAEVQRELRPGVSVTGGYYRNWSGNFRVTDNLAVTPADYSPFCITAPVDARLPGGGGYQVCGLYDVAPAKFGRVDNLVTTASQFYGPKTSANCGATFSAALSLGSSGCGTSDNVGVSVKARLAQDIQVGGGVDTGRTVIDNCFVVNSPQQLLNCRVVIPFKALTQVKVFGSSPLPAHFIVSATFKNYGGSDFTADYQARNVEVAPVLGRDLAACGSRTGAACAATVTVPLIAPMTQFLDRITMIDLRLSKILRLGSRGRLQAHVDVYNLLNASTLIGANNNYGSLWQHPFSPSGTVDSITPGRMLQFGGELSF